MAVINALRNFANRNIENQTNPLTTENAEVVNEPPQTFTGETFQQITPEQKEQVFQQQQKVSGQNQLLSTTGTPMSKQQFLQTGFQPPPPGTSFAVPEDAPEFLQPQADVQQVLPTQPAPTPPDVSFSVSPQETQDAVNTGNANELLNQMFSNTQSFFAGFDWQSIGNESQNYLTQLLTGQTDATRALQAKEAAAMSQGIQNLMNNISSTAANAGITGGALQDLYNQGIQQVGQMMGDFAMDNLIRMGETQAKGFQGLVDMFNLNTDQQQTWMQTFQDFDRFQKSNTQADRIWGWNSWQYITELAATDPAAAQIMSKVQQALTDGVPISQVLTPDEIATIGQQVNEAQDPIDIANEVSYIQDQLGFKALVTQRTGADGQPVFKADGTPIWDVTIATTVNDDGTMTFVPFEGAEGAVGTEVEGEAITIEKDGVLTEFEVFDALPTNDIWSILKDSTTGEFLYRMQDISVERGKLDTPMNFNELISAIKETPEWRTQEMIAFFEDMLEKTGELPSGGLQSLIDAGKSVKPTLEPPPVVPFPITPPLTEFPLQP